MESGFQSRALSYLNSIPGCKAENVSGNAQQSGRPDINGCYKGRMFKLELKVPDHKNKASVKQILTLRKWTSAGCAVGILYSMKSLKEFMKVLMEPMDVDAFQAFLPEENGCESWFRIERIHF